MKLISPLKLLSSVPCRRCSIKFFGAIDDCIHPIHAEGRLLPVESAAAVACSLNLSLAFF